MNTSLHLSAIVDEWLNSIDVMPITKASYKTKINLWFRWLSANGVAPRTPVRHNIIDYKQSLEREGKSSLTVDGYVTAVKLFYKYCNTVGYWSSIGDGIRSSARYRGHRKSALTPDEAAQLIASLDGERMVDRRDRLMFSLMLYLGLRTCEVERINLNDFDIINGQSVLRIQRKGRREKVEMLSVSDEIIELVEGYTSYRNFDLDDPLFATHINRGVSHRLARTSISKIVKERLRRIGIDRKDITAHSLRHTCASIMVEQGVSIETIRDMLGHTTTNTTWLYTSEARQRMLIKNSPSLIVERAIKNSNKQLTME